MSTNEQNMFPRLKERGPIEASWLAVNLSK